MPDEQLPDPSGKPRAAERGSAISDLINIVAGGAVCLVILAVLANVTAIHRIFFVATSLREP